MYLVNAVLLRVTFEHIDLAVVGEGEVFDDGERRHGWKGEESPIERKDPVRKQAGLPSCPKDQRF